MRANSHSLASLVLIVSLIGLPPTQAGAQAPQGEEAQAAREQKAADLTPQRRSLVERVLFKLEDDLLLKRVFDPPRGVYVRVGKIGEGAGFALGPALRYNTPAFDFKTSAAGSTKRYFLGEASIRFPGTVGTDSYIKPEGLYVELYGRHRDFPQEDFFGLGPDTLPSHRSDFSLRDNLGRVSTGYERGQFKAGVAAGYLEVAVGPGRDVLMPSASTVFTRQQLPGFDDRPAFVIVGPFVEFATVDGSKNDRTGGRYRVSVSEYRDRDLGRYSFRLYEADLRQYLTFVKDTRILALRVATTSAVPGAGQEVPFYLQPTLGGSRSLRGYLPLRFRDRSTLLLQAEYRWRINEFVGGALFYDTGAVAQTLRDLGRFERNYGFGLRAGGREGAAFRLDFAFGGREGRRLLLRFDDAF